MKAAREAQLRYKNGVDSGAATTAVNQLQRDAQQKLQNAKALETIRDQKMAKAKKALLGGSGAKKKRKDQIDIAQKDPIGPQPGNVDPSKPYPAKNQHWDLPNKKTGKVKKWCSTKFGAVPCKTLAIAKQNGLLGEDITSDDHDAHEEGYELGEAQSFGLGESIEEMPEVKIDW